MYDICMYVCMYYYYYYYYYNALIYLFTYFFLLTSHCAQQYVYYGSKNAGVDYKFFVPGKFKLSPAEVEWKTTEWSKCTETCGGGKNASFSDANTHLLELQLLHV